MTLTTLILTASQNIMTHTSYSLYRSGIILGTRTRYMFVTSGTENVFEDLIAD